MIRGYQKALQGLFKPQNIDKYIGNTNAIKYRSSLELSAFINLDRSENVKRWASEQVHIPYFFNGRHRKYIMDLYCEVIDPVSGEISYYLVEIKHSKKLKPPVKPKYITKRYLKLLEEYQMNKTKWLYAQQYAQKMGWSFKVITEDGVDLKSIGV